MRVSVVLPTREAAQYLESTLRSIVEQTLPPTEILIVDAGSRDATRAIVAAAARAHAAVRLLDQEGPTLSSAYSQGIFAATGEALAFATSDDPWHPEKLALLSARLAATPPVEFVTSFGEVFLEPGCALPANASAHWFEGARPLLLLESLLIRCDVARELGAFADELGSSADVEWLGRLATRGARGATVERVLVRRRIHDRNLSLFDPEAGRLRLAALRRTILARRRCAAGGC